MLNNKIVRFVLIGILSVVFVFSAVMIAKNLYDSENAKYEFEQLNELTTNSENDTVSGDDSSENSESNENNGRNITLLQAMNKECIGWISIPDTQVNYPVMHTPDNPEKYLKRNFNNKYSAAGVPFMDARCDLDSTNIIIYGHNMKNRSMFGSLRNYLKSDYLKAHPIIEFETTDGCHYYTIVEVRKTDINDSWYTHNLYASQDGKEYLTLSTCRGTNKNDRLLIIAVKNEEYLSQPE